MVWCGSAVYVMLETCGGKRFVAVSGKWWFWLLMVRDRLLVRLVAS